MALINCPECNKEVSDTANTCIHCGYEFVEKKSIATKLKKHKMTLSIITIIIIVIIIGINLFSGSIGLTKNERIALNDIKTLQKTLLDPDSIIIYDAFVSQGYYAEDEESGTYVYYGAKNKGGGITDNWALIFKDDVKTKSGYDEAVKNGDIDEAVTYNDFVVVEIQVSMGSDNWQKADIDKVSKRIK